MIRIVSVGGGMVTRPLQSRAISNYAKMAFSLRQIRYFMAIAEIGSLSGAAKELAVSQSSIAVGIQDLEREFACQLFDRHARGMILTVKGHQFLRHARNILASIADARRGLEDEGPGNLKGQLNLGVTTLVAGYVLAELLARFRRAFPGVEVKMVEDNREDLEHFLVGGELDAAAVILPPGQAHHTFEASVLETSPYRLWLSVNHPLAARQEIDARALEAAPHVLLATDEIAEDAESRWERLGIRPKVILRTRSVEGVRSLVATGAGVAVLPDLAYRPWSLEGDKVEARRLQEEIPPAVVGVVWRRGAKLSPPAQALLSVVRARR